MSHFVVSFMKDVLGDNGRQVEICQRTVEIDASTEGVATELAKQWFLQGRTALRMVAACRPHPGQARTIGLRLRLDGSAAREHASRRTHRSSTFRQLAGG